jgi:cell division protein FtsW (lipid II flippase)
MRESDERRAARRLRRSRARLVVLGVVVFGITAAALVLSAIRTYLVLLAVALPVVYVVMRGRRAWKVLIPVLLVVGIALGALSRVDPQNFEREGAEAGIRRVIAVLNDPFSSHADNYDNTLQVHWDAVKTGIEQAFDHPVGRGTGSTGISGNQEEQTFSTDFDLSDAGIAFGLLGLLVTCAIVLFGVFSSIRVALWRRTFERVALVGVLIVSFGTWFQGAHYVMAPLLWLLLGRCDAAIARGRDADAVLEPAADSDDPGDSAALDEHAVADGAGPTVAVS